MSECEFCGSDVDNLETHVKQFHDEMSMYAEEGGVGSGPQKGDSIPVKNSIGVHPDKRGQLKNPDGSFATRDTYDDYIKTHGEANIYSDESNDNRDSDGKFASGNVQDAGDDMRFSKNYLDTNEEIDRKYENKSGFPHQTGMESKLNESWDFKPYNDKSEAFEAIGFNQGDALKMADLSWYNLSNEVQNALEVEDADKIEKHGDPQIFDDQPEMPLDDMDDIDYNIIGESTTRRSKYECEWCNHSAVSNESLMIHHNDIHTSANEFAIDVPNTCTFCNQEIGENVSMAEHLAYEHGIELPQGGSLGSGDAFMAGESFKKKDQFYDLVANEEFDESKHNRDSDGKFGTGGGGSSKNEYDDMSEKDIVKQIKSGSKDFKDWYRNEENEHLYAEIEKRNKSIPKPTGTYPKIFRDDPDAVSKMEQKIKVLEDRQAYWKKIIKFPARDFKNMQQLGDQKWYALTGASTDLREAKKKLEGIKAQQARGTTLTRKPTYQNGRKNFYYSEEPKTSEALLKGWKSIIAMAQEDFREEDHPRAPDGKFGSGGGSSSGNGGASNALTPPENDYDRLLDLASNGKPIEEPRLKALDNAMQSAGDEYNDLSDDAKDFMADHADALLTFQSLEGDDIYVQEVDEGSNSARGEGKYITLSNGATYNVYESHEDMEAEARQRIEDDLDEGLFNRDFMDDHMTIDDYSKTEFARGDARSQVDPYNDVSYDDLIEMADEEGVDYEEGIGEDELREKMEDHYTEEYEGIIDREGFRYYIVDHMGYTRDEDFMEEYGEKHMSIDYKSAIEDALEMDGAEHFLSGYDGNSHETEDGKYLVKHND